MRKFTFLFLLMCLLGQSNLVGQSTASTRVSEDVTVYGVRAHKNGRNLPVRELIRFNSLSSETVDSLKANIIPGEGLVSAGEYANGYYYLYGTVDMKDGGVTPQTFEFIQISIKDWSIIKRTVMPSGNILISDMAYDYTSNTMFAAELSYSSFTTDLKAVNLENGEMTLVKNTGKAFWTLACSDDGQLYGVSLAGEFCSINKTTGETTVIRTVSDGQNAIQSMVYDNINDKILWSRTTGSNFNIAKLIEIDPVSGVTTEVGSIGQISHTIGLFSGVLVIGEETTPANKAVEVDIFEKLSVTFKEDITGLDLSSIKIEPSITGVVASINGNKLTIEHDDFDFSTEYTVTIPSTAIKGLNNEFKWSFTTLPDPGMCNIPSQLTVEELDSYNALVSWRENGAALSWDIKFGEKGFDVETEGALVSGLIEKSHQFTELNEATEYDFYVRAVCYANETTEWSPVKSFRTPMDCDKPYTAFPWTEGFEDELFPAECWSRFDYDTATIENEQWERNVNFFRTGKASAAHLWNLNKPQEGWLVTRKFGIPAGDDTYVLKFWNMNRFAENYVYNGVWISEGSPNPEDGDFVEAWTPLTVAGAWQEEKVNLSEHYAGKDIYIAFKYVSKGQANGIISQQWFIDDLVIETYNHKDIQLVSIDKPARSGAGFSANQEVEVTLYNYGSEPIIDLPITLKVNGTTVAQETITETIHSLTTYQYTFSKKVDMSQPGSYTFDIEVELEDDQSMENNSISKGIFRIADEYLTMYGYSIMSFPLPDNHFISFNTKDVFNTKYTELAQYTAGLNMVVTAGEYLDGYFYMFVEDSITHDVGHFIKIDTKTWTEVSRTEKVIVHVREMTFDYSTNTMYFVTASSAGVSELHTVDVKTGDTKYVVSLEKYFHGLACDLDGQMYGIAPEGVFCKIDKETGKVDVIRKTGYIRSGYIQSMAFDHNSGRLFWAMVGLPDANSLAYGGFIELDKTTGYHHFYGRIWLNTEVVGLHTPYDRGVLLDSYSPTGTDVALDAEVSVEFNVDITAEELSRATITPDPGSVSATIEGHKIIIAHAPFAGETEYTVTVPVGTIAGYDEAVSWKFTTTKEQGIARDKDVDIRLYPNPSTGVVYVTAPENSTIKVFDLSGRMVEEIKGQSKDITLTLDVADGIYFIQVESNGSRVSRKLIIKK